MLTSFWLCLFIIKLCSCDDIYKQVGFTKEDTYYLLKMLKKKKDLLGYGSKVIKKVLDLSKVTKYDDLSLKNKDKKNLNYQKLLKNLKLLA